MGNGTSGAVGSDAGKVYTLPIVTVEGEIPKADKSDKAPSVTATPAAAPKPEDYKKLIAKAQSLGVKLDLDEQGNIKPEKLDEVKGRVAKAMDDKIKEGAAKNVKPGDGLAQAAVFVPHLLRQTEFVHLPKETQLALLKERGYKDPEKIVDAIEKDFPPHKKIGQAIAREAQAREAKGGIEDKKDAARLYDTAAGFCPGDLIIRRGAARNLKSWADSETNPDDKKKLYASAAFHLDPVLKATPKDIELLKTAGQIQQGLGNTGEAEKFFAAAQKELIPQFKEKLKEYQSHPGRTDAEARLKPLQDLMKQIEEIPPGDAQSKFERLVCTRDLNQAAYSLKFQGYPPYNGPRIKTEQWISGGEGGILDKLVGHKPGRMETYYNDDPVALAAYETKKKEDLAPFKSKVEAANQEIQKLQTDLRAKADNASLPPSERLAAAKQAVQFSIALGDNKGRVQNLDQWKKTLDSFGYSDIKGPARAQAYSEVLGEWHKLRTEMSDPDVIDLPTAKIKERFSVDAYEATSRMRDIAPRIRESCDYMETKDAMDKIDRMLNRLIDEDDKKLLPFLSADGLEKYAKASADADQKFKIAKDNLAAAKTPEDVKKARGDLLVALGTYTALRDHSAADEVVKAMEGTFKADTKPTEKLEIYTALSSVLKGSDFSSYNHVREQGRTIAAQMSGECLARTTFSDSQTPVDDAKKLLLCKTFFETVGDKDQAKAVNVGLEGLGDKILNVLHSPDPKIKPTDPKTRVELASLVVQMDQALLETAVADAGKPDSTGPKVNTVQAARLGVLRRELEKAKDLPFEFRLEQYKRLAASAATYKALTEPVQKNKGHLAVIDAETLKKETEAIEKLGDAILSDVLTPTADATPAQKEMAAKMTADLKARHHQAIEKGDVQWLSNLTPASITEFALVSGKANRLLEMAQKLPADRVDEAMSLYLEAGKQFGLLGLESKIETAMKPVLEHARSLPDPMQKAAGFMAISQVYQSSKMTEKANGVLQELVDLDKPGASQEIKDAAQLGRGMQKLNEGKLDEAKDFFKSLPKNEIAKAMLKNITDGQKALRVSQAVEVTRIIFSSKAQALRDKGKTAEADAFEKASMGALDEAKRLVLSGKCQDLEAGIRKVMYDPRFSAADLGMFLFETGPGWKTWSFIRSADDPKVTNKDFAEMSLSFARQMTSDKYYGAADAIATMFLEDAYVKDKAKVLKEELPDQVKIDGIFKTVKSLVAMNPVGAFLSITFTPKELGSDEDPVKEILTDVGIGLATFGIGKGFAIAADAIYVSRAASLLSRPMIYNVGRWAVRSGAEATGFTLGSMGAQALLTGKTDHITLAHFGQEWGAMIVMFGMMHGVGMGFGKFGKYAEGKGWTNSAAFQAGFKTGQYVGTIGAFTGSEYVNEAIGLKKKENTPLYLRILGSMATDALMKQTHKITYGTLEAATLGRVKLGNIEKATQSTYEAQIQVKKMGIEPGSADGKLVVDAMMGKGEGLSAEAQKRYGDTVKSVFKADPKSAEGKELASLLFIYSHRASEKSGKPMSEPELFRAAEELNLSVKMLLKGSGIAEGKESDALRGELVRMALENQVKPEVMEQFAKQASDMKDRLHDITNTIFGPGGSKTEAGQRLMSALLVKAMTETSDPTKLVDTLDGLAHAAKDTGDALRFTVNTILGKGSSGTAEGRELMSVLLMNAMVSSEKPSDIPDKIGELGTLGVDIGDPLRASCNTILGPGGSKTAEGRRFMARLLLRTLEGGEASTAADRLAEIDRIASERTPGLKGAVALMMEGKSTETPEGRALMGELLLEAVGSAKSRMEMIDGVDRVIDVGTELAKGTPSIFDISGAKTPGNKLALIRWASETNQTSQTLAELSQKGQNGEVTWKVEGGEARLVEVPKEKQPAMKKAVEDSLPFKKISAEDLKAFGEDRQKFIDMCRDPKTALDAQALQTRLDGIKARFEKFGKELEKEIGDLQSYMRVRSAVPQMGYESQFNNGARCWVEGSGDQAKYFYEYKSEFGPIRRQINGPEMMIFYAYERWVDKLADVTADAVLAGPPPLPAAARSKTATPAAEEPLPMAAKKTAVAPISSKKPGQGPALSLAGGTMKEAMELAGEFGFKNKDFLKEVGRGAEPGKFDSTQAREAFQAVDKALGTVSALEQFSIRRAIFADVVQGKLTPEQAKKLATDMVEGRVRLEITEGGYNKAPIAPADQPEVRKEAAIRLALQSTGLDRTDPKNNTKITELRNQLTTGLKEGKFTVEDLHRASGKDLPKARIAELEGQLGKSSTEWSGEFAKDPAGFLGKMDAAVKAVDFAKDPANPASKGVGMAEFKPVTAIEAKADKIAKGAPSAERIKRYEDYLVKNKNYTREQAREAAQAWASKVIHDARAHQAGRTHIYDTSLPAKPENLHLDKATVDHHGRFANPKNSTEQLVDRMEFALETVKKDSKALEAAKQDSASMEAAKKGLEQAGVKNPSEQQVAEIAAALRTMNLKEVTTDNLADGGWSVWMAKNQARVLADPALRKLITDATHFEDFTAFGTTYDVKDPGVRLQASLFQKYGDILKSNGIIGSDRFPPDKAAKVMGEALKAIDEMVADPAKREAAASEFFAKVEEGRKIVLEQAVMKDVSVTQGDTQLIFVDLTKLGDFTVFQQWLAIPQAEVVPGKPHTMQVSVVPLGKAKMVDGREIDASRTLQIVAIPDGRKLPTGKNMLAAVDRVNARELAKAEELGLVPKEGQEVGPGQVPREQYAKVWFGKDVVILPNPGKGTLLSPREVSDIMTDASLKPGEKPLEMFQKAGPKAADPNSMEGIIGGDATMTIKAGLPSGSKLADTTLHVKAENAILTEQGVQKQLATLPDSVKNDPNAYVAVHMEIKGVHTLVVETYKNLSNPDFLLPMIAGRVRPSAFELSYKVQGDSVHLEYIGRGPALEGGGKGLGEGAFRGFAEHLQSQYPGKRITAQVENIKIAEFFTQYLDSAQAVTIGSEAANKMKYPIDGMVSDKLVTSLKDQGYLTADQATKIQQAPDKFAAHDLFFQSLKANQQAAATEGKTSAKNEVAYLLEGLSRLPESVKKFEYLGTLWIEAKVPSEAGPPSSKPKGDAAPITLRSPGAADPGLAKGFSERGERIIPSAEFGQILVDKKGELIRPANEAEQKAYLEYKKSFTAEAKRLNVGFDQGQKIIPDGKGSWVLNGANGKAIRSATGQEQALYLDFKKDLASKEVATKALVRGFAENGEKILPDKEFGQVLVNREGELLRPASKAELKSYLDYKKAADVRAKELNAGFKAGQKVLPDGKGGFTLNGKEGTLIGTATAADLRLYLDHKRATDTATKELVAGFEKGQRILPDGKGGNVLVEPQTDGSVKTLRAATAEEQGMYLSYKKAADAKAGQAERQSKALESGFYSRGERIIPDKKYGNILVDRNGELIRPASLAEQGQYLKWKTKVDRAEDLTSEAKTEAPPLPLEARFKYGQKVLGPYSDGKFYFVNKAGERVGEATKEQSLAYVSHKRKSAEPIDVTEFAKMEPPPLPGQKAAESVPQGKLYIPPPVPRPREGTPAGLLMGGSAGSGGHLIVPRDGKAVDSGHGVQFRYNSQTSHYEQRKAGAGQWAEVKPGQKIQFGKMEFVFVELRGSPKGSPPDRAVADLNSQVDYQLAKEGSSQHLQGLKAKGREVTQADADNLTLFYSEGFKQAQKSHDAGNDNHPKAGVFGGSTEAFAYVDPKSGQILGFASRTPKPGEAGADGSTSPLWVIQSGEGGKLQWVDKTNTHPSEPVEGMPKGAVLVPMTLERQTGRISVDKASLKSGGFSETGLRRMENIDGFVGKAPSTGASEGVFSYMFGEAKNAKTPKYQEPIDVTADAKLIEPPPLPAAARKGKPADGSALSASDKTGAGTPSALSGKKPSAPPPSDSGVRAKELDTPTPTEFMPLKPLKEGEVLQHGQDLYLKAGETLKPYVMNENGEPSPQAKRLAELAKLPGAAGSLAAEALRTIDMIRTNASGLKDIQSSAVMAKYTSDNLTMLFARLEGLNARLKPALEGKTLDPTRTTELKKEAQELGGELFGAELKRAAGEEDARDPQWVREIGQAAMLADPAVSARAKEVRAAADEIPKTLEAIQTLEVNLQAGKIPADQKVNAEKQLNDLHLLLDGQMAVVKSWKTDAAKVASIGRGMRDVEFPYRQDEVRNVVRANELIPEEMKPEGPNCKLDFSIPFRDQDIYPTLRANLYGSVGTKPGATDSNTLVFEVKDAAGQKAMTDYVKADMSARFPEKTVKEESTGLLRVTQKDGTEFFVHIEIYKAQAEPAPVVVDLKPTVAPPPPGGGGETIKPGKLNQGDAADKGTVRPGKLNAAPGGNEGLATVRPGKPAEGDRSVVVSYTDPTKVGGPDAKLLDDATPPGTPLRLEFAPAGDGRFSAERGGLKFMSVEDNKFIVQGGTSEGVTINGHKEPSAKWFELNKDDVVQVEGRTYAFTGTELIKVDPFSPPSSKAPAPKPFALKAPGSEAKDFAPAADDKSGVREKTDKPSTPPSTNPPGGGIDFANPVIPKPGKTPTGDLYREAAVSLSIYEKVFPAEKGKQGSEAYIGREFVAELGRISKTMTDTGNAEIALKMEADLKTVRTAEKGSQAYNQAIDRLASVVKMRRYGQDLSDKPVENGQAFISKEVDWMGEGTLSQFSKAVGKVYGLEAKPSQLADAAPASGKKVVEKDEWADFDDPGAKPASKKGATMPPPSGKKAEVDEWADFNDPSVGPASKKEGATQPPPSGFKPATADKEASGPVTMVPGSYDPKALSAAGEPKFIAQTQKGDVVEGTSDVYRVRVQTEGGPKEVSVRLDPEVSVDSGGAEKNLYHSLSFVSLDKAYEVPGGGKLRFTGNILGQGSASTIFEAKVTTPQGEKIVAVKLRTHAQPGKMLVEDPNFKRSEWDASVKTQIADEGKAAEVLAQFDPSYKGAGLMTAEGGHTGVILPRFDVEGSKSFYFLSELSAADQKIAGPQLKALVEGMAKQGHAFGDVEFILDKSGKLHVIDIEGINLNTKDPQIIAQGRDILDVPAYAPDPALFGGAEFGKTMPPPGSYDPAKVDKEVSGPQTLKPKGYFPKALDVLAEGDTPAVKAPPTPRQVLGDKVMEGVKGAILADPEINKKGQIQAGDIHEISCNLSELKPTIDKIAGQIPKDQLPKTLFFIADMKRPDGSHVVSLVKHEMFADGETRTSPNNSIFTFNYRVTEGTNGEPTRVRVDYIKAREDLRGKVVSPAVSSLLEFAAKEYPGATVETRADNLISAQLAGANLEGTRFIEVTDPKKYPVAKMLEPQLVDHMATVKVLNADQATKLKAMIGESVPEDQKGAQAVKVHNQFISYVRENYAKNPGEASNEVSFVFQNLRRSKEALAFIRESPYRGDLWVEGQAKAKAPKGSPEPLPLIKPTETGTVAAAPSEYKAVEIPGGSKIGGQEYTVGLKETAEGKVYRFQDAKGVEVLVRVPEGQYVAHIDRSLGGKGDSNADPARLTRALLDKIATKDPQLIGKIAEYETKTGQTLSLNTLSEISLKAGLGADKILSNAAAYKGFIFEAGQPNPQKVTLTGEILGIGSNSAVYKGIVTDSKGNQTPVAVKLAPETKAGNLIKFDKAEIGGSKFYGTAHIGVESKSQQPYTRPVGESGPNALVMNYSEGVLVKGFNEVPEAFKEQVYREAVKDVGKLVKKGFVSFDDSNYLVRTGEKADRRLEWIDLDGAKFGPEPSTEKYPEAYRAALKQVGIPEKYWPAELKAGEAPKDTKVASGKVGTVPPPSSGPPSSGSPGKAWVKSGDQVLDLSALNGAERKVALSGEKGNFAVTGDQSKSILSIRQGPRSYRLDAATGLNGSEMIVMTKDAKGQDRPIYLKAPMGLALTPGEYKVMVNGKEMTLNLPPISADVVPLSSRSRAVVSFDTAKVSATRKAEVDEILAGKNLKTLIPSEQKALALELADKKGWNQQELQNLMGPEGMRRYFGYGEELPFGFQSVEQFHAFEKTLMARLSAAGIPINDPRVKIVIQGSAVRGEGEKGSFRWVGDPKAADKKDQPSDIDIAIIVDDSLFKEFVDKRVQTIKDKRAANPTREDGHLNWNQTIGSDGRVKVTKDSKKLEKEIEKRRLGPHHLYGDLSKAHNAMRDDYPMRGIQISIMTAESKFAPTPDEAMVLSAGETSKAAGF